jgi:hypothetical protein
VTKLLAWIALALLVVMPGAARAGDPLKPYVVLILDTSGSMVGTSFGNPTGSGPPTCGGVDNKLNHAMCAINKITNSYGDMVFALARFRTTVGGTISGTFPTGCCMAGPNIGANGSCTAGPTCTSGQPNDHMFELLSPLVDGDNDRAGAWTNGTANSCTTVGTDPELWDRMNTCNGGDGTCGGGTPLDGSLRGAKRYWQGLQATNGATTLWPSNLSGFDPIRTDPTKTAFLPRPGTGSSSCNPNPATCNATANCTGANCCCLEQCRPYVVIMLTDGDESCFGDPTIGAGSLLTTDVDSRRYRIKTKAIGFGVPVGSATIENIAHAGGAPNVPGVNEGFYAQNEAELQLAISAILDDAIKTEQCNNLDDDCDLAIDEDFPDKGNQCDNGKLGVCRRTGTLECRPDGTGLQCNAPAGPAPGVEICNGLDDDCDGKIDEGANCNCVPQGEQCNGIDDDCDGNIDEGIPPRPCNNGLCQGVETCVNGSFAGTCTAATPSAEVCNGIDDNCDGVIDGFVEACSNLSQGFPAFDPRNNPGHPSRSPIPENLCQPGNRTCPSTPPPGFGPCLGEIVPTAEVCNGLDDDCDNKIDEGTGGADCSSSCGVGTTVCMNGQIVCNAVPALSDDTCDGNDDDCDGQIDEDWVCDDPPNCGCTASGQCNAVQSCVNGVVLCQGDPVSQESCDCLDNDCDGKIDEGSLCPAGATCASCQCAFECSPSEFPCPLGKFCKDGFCIADPCFGVDCPPAGGIKQVCQVNAQGNQGTCVDVCSVITCSPLICIPETGECKPDDCTTFPERCADNQSCVVNAQGLGECVTNLCQGVTCPSGQYCVAGACHGSCAGVTCPVGTRCRLGKCEDDPCGKPCPFGQACNDNTGQCVDDGCDLQNCPQGQWCNPNNNGGRCEPDPCVIDAIECPTPEEVCKGGTCYDPVDFLPDAGVPVIVTTGGGGGCSTGSGGAGLLAGLALLVIAPWRRRRGARA